MTATNQGKVKEESPNSSQGDVDYIGILKYLLSRKWTILFGTTVATTIGLLVALLSPSIYSSFAVIAPKEQNGGRGNSGLLSQLGGLGGMVVGQLGIGDNNMSRMEIILRSTQLAQSIIETHDLLKFLYPKQWDARAGKWKSPDTGAHPSKLKASIKLKQEIVTVTTDEKRKVLTITARTFNPALSADIVNFYLEALSSRIARDVRIDADSNRSYLQSQLDVARDPQLREKIQGLIGGEIERAMLVSSKSFDILDAPIVSEDRESPKRKLIVILSTVIGFLFSSMGVMALNSINAYREQARNPIFRRETT